MPSWRRFFGFLKDEPHAPRFSSRRNAITSSRSRGSHPHSMANTNWNGNTAEVYAGDARSAVGHYEPLILTLRRLPHGRCDRLFLFRRVP